MKALVAIKRAVDFSVKVRLASSQSVDLNVKHSMNPFCEIALEQALKWKEAGVVSEIVAVSVGNAKNQDSLRHALALGADRGILVSASAGQLDVGIPSTYIARILAELTRKEDPKVVFMGKQAIDSDGGCTGQVLAGLLGWPQVTFASKCLQSAGNIVDVEREVESGIEAGSVELPAVITADLRLNTPRFVTLPNIVKAKSKRLDVIDEKAVFGEQAGKFREFDSVTLESVSNPPARKPGIKVSSVEELVEKLTVVSKVL